MTEQNNEMVLKEEEKLLPNKIEITQQQVELIKNTIASGASDDELKLFFYECRRRGVHPLDRFIHFVKRQGKVAFQAGIDFMRSQAEESGEYRGQEDIEYGSMKLLANHPEINVPEWATAKVRRRDPLTGEVYITPATAYWDEYYPGEQLGFKWRQSPRHMLGKCAESLALRKAFPRQLHGLYSFEEMEQAGGEDREPIRAPQAKSAKTETKAESSEQKLSEEAQKLFNLLAEIYKNDKEKMVLALKALSSYEKNGKVHEGKTSFLEISEPMARTCRHKFEKMMEKCPKNSMECEFSSFDDKGNIYCCESLFCCFPAEKAND